MSVSLLMSDSAVSKKTLLPSGVLPLKNAVCTPLPPFGPIEISVVVAAERM
jgi:hypothetical protein